MTMSKSQRNTPVIDVIRDWPHSERNYPLLIKPVASLFKLLNSI